VIVSRLAGSVDPSFSEHRQQGDAVEGSIPRVVVIA